MLRYGPWLLAILFAFGAFFALLPGNAGEQNSAGVELYGVDFRLYPAQDAEAEWRFRSRRITFDPVTGESKLDGLSRGERFLRGTLDMTLKADALSIDAAENLHMKRAEAYVLDSCSTVVMRGAAGRDVVIDQNAGYVAPSIALRSPGIVGDWKDATLSFNFDAQGLTQRFEIDPDAPETCRNGKIVAKAEAP